MRKNLRERGRMFFETNRSIEKNYFYTQSDEDLNFVSHVHNSYEFITVLDGELECGVYRDSYLLRPGKAMLIFPNHVHNYKTPAHSRSFLCVFSADFVADFHSEMKNGGYSSALFDFSDESWIARLQDRAVNRYLLRSVLYGFCGLACPNLIQYYESGGGWGVAYPSNCFIISSGITISLSA